MAAWCLFVFAVCDLQVVQEYERAVIFRLGQLVRGRAKGPGKEYCLSVKPFSSISTELSGPELLFRGALGCSMWNRGMPQSGRSPTFDPTDLKRRRKKYSLLNEGKQAFPFVLPHKFCVKHYFIFNYYTALLNAAL